MNHVHVYHDVRSAVTSMREGRECSFEKRKASKTSSSRPVLAPRRKDSNSNSNSNEFELSAATLLQMRLSEQVTLDQRLTPVKKDVSIVIIKKLSAHLTLRRYFDLSSTTCRPSACRTCGTGGYRQVWEGGCIGVSNM